MNETGNVAAHSPVCGCTECVPYGVAHVAGFGSFRVPAPSVFMDDECVTAEVDDAAVPHGFRVRLTRTRLPAAFKPWRPFWWRMVRLAWGRWGEAWGITGHALRLGELCEYETVCVAFGPLVIVVEMPDRSGERVQ